MPSVKDLIAQRAGGQKKSRKAIALAKRASEGERNGFAGLFRVAKLSKTEETLITEILHRYGREESEIERDAMALATITSEVKAITNQAALLHGERIDRAHTILTHYREGAFTAWLMAAYGNRTTPYNLWQYYRFHKDLPPALRPKLETMPRQAIYTLASRKGSQKEKLQVVQDYRGATKRELLEQIRLLFPLEQGDRRKSSVVLAAEKQLRDCYSKLESQKPSLSSQQRRELRDLLRKIRTLIETLPLEETHAKKRER